VHQSAGGRIDPPRVELPRAWGISSRRRRRDNLLCYIRNAAIHLSVVPRDGQKLTKKLVTNSLTNHF